MNNLNDISLDEDYGELCGYTQAELEGRFSDRLGAVAAKFQWSREKLLAEMKDRYDGFCFDGVHKVYAPWSVMCALNKMEFGNYWYDSASPPFLTKYMTQHRIPNLEVFHEKVVSRDFMSSREIEHATPESLLCQAGYLTLAGKDEDSFTLDYPNKEVLDSLSLYMEVIYRVPDSFALGRIVKAGLEKDYMPGVMEAFGKILSAVPYSDFQAVRESLYRSVFLAALRSSGILCVAEAQNSEGRADVTAILDGRVYVFEFKVARKPAQADKLLDEGKSQILARKYAEHENSGRKVSRVALVIDDEKHSVAA